MHRDKELQYLGARGDAAATWIYGGGCSRTPHTSLPPSFFYWNFPNSIATGVLWSALRAGVRVVDMFRTWRWISHSLCSMKTFLFEHAYQHIVFSMFRRKSGPLSVAFIVLFPSSMSACFLFSYGRHSFLWYFFLMDNMSSYQSCKSFNKRKSTCSWNKSQFLEKITITSFVTHSAGIWWIPIMCPPRHIIPVIPIYLLSALSIAIMCL